MHKAMVREGVCGVRSGGLGYVDISQIQVKCLCCGRQEWRPYNIIYDLVDSKNAPEDLNVNWSPVVAVVVILW